MKVLRRFALLATVASAAIIADGAALAQDTASALRGQVVSPSGAAIANVTVEIIHVPTGTTKTLTTDSQGRFSARGLLVGGPYTVRLADGSEFTAQNITDLFTRLGRPGNVVLVANSGGDIEEVVVLGQRLVGGLKVGSASTFGQSIINSTPSISRDLKSVIQRDPKIMVDQTVDGGPGLSIAGGNLRFNSLTVDGIPQNDNFGLNKNGYPGRRVPISIDAIEAITVNVAPFDVTYGNFLGGNINVVTKSGSNEVHGSAFFAYSDQSLAGTKSEGETLSIGNFNEKTFGFNVGAPLVIDKLFVFVNYEKFELSRPFPLNISDFNGVTQADIDEAGRIAQQNWGFDAGGFAAQNPEDDEKILIKLDWNINDNHRMSASYTKNSGNAIRDFFSNPSAEVVALYSNRYNMAETIETYSAQLFSDWTDNFSTEIKLGFKNNKTRQNSTSPDFSAMTIGTAGGGTIRLGPDQFRHANSLDNDTTLFKVKGDYFMGDHTFTAGYEMEQVDVDNLFVFWSKAEFSFGSLADFENRSPFLTTFSNSPTGDPTNASSVFSFKTHSIYFQDEWTPSNDLTIFAGLRYDWVDNDTFPTENPNFEARNGFKNTLNMNGLDLIMPRVGFNYTVAENTTLRGGAGLFGGGTPNVWLSNSYANTGMLSNLSFTGTGTDPAYDAAVQAILAGPIDGSTARTALTPFVSIPSFADTNGIAPTYKTSSSWKYNLAIDQTFDLTSWGMGDGWDVTVEAIYTDVKNAAYIRETRRSVQGTAPDGRPIYDSFFSFTGFDLLLDSTSKGDAKIYSIDVSKSFALENGYIDLYMGYARQDSNEVNPGNDFIAFEAFGMHATTDRNATILFPSEYEIKNRITASVSWKGQLFGENDTTVSMFYEGRNGRHFSYTFNETLAFGGAILTDFFNNNNSQSFYVPTGPTDPLVDMSALSAADQTALFNLIDNTACLADFAGSATPRNACTNDWINRVDLRIDQEFKIPGVEHALEFSLAMENFGNFLNSNWGRQSGYNLPFTVPLVDVDIQDGQFIYSNFSIPNKTVSTIPSVWKLQFAVKYRF